ncbi:motility associated factor glycosyltransferase family protein [Bacillus xiapuensis]|uniref:motility associated factor glycosyltransferase family protein n=1 Tax=Bacillus xiapuensis TaxID=2014075 RepID=UPI000C241445|nr:6-hydroxymethylpterin diphosphokinase MptE-like protein [Bacillus xiapuensis]
MQIKTIETRTVPTVQLEYLGKTLTFHSKYNPLHEAEVWCKNAVERIKKNQQVLVIGLGAGYHIQLLAKLLPEQSITVIEFNEPFFNWFTRSSFYPMIADVENVSVKSFSQLLPDERKAIFSSVSSTNLLIHKNGIDIIPTEFQNIKALLDDIKLQNGSINNQLENMQSNFNRNVELNDQGIRELVNRYKGRPMILVSAGPSLDKQLPLLKKIRDENTFIIGAVGTAVKPLIQHDIVPDFFVIIDPNKGTYKQLTDVCLPETTLFYLCTAYHDTVMLHKGPRRILWQEGFAEAEKMAGIRKDPTIQTGGSVATALLDLMVLLGGERIALIGQDLAFTDGKSHANRTHAQKEMKQLKPSQKVLSYDQTGEVYTAKNLNIYRKWFETFAREHPHLHLYNCTEGGAYIHNWEHIRLQDYYVKYKP